VKKNVSTEVRSSFLFCSSYPLSVLPPHLVQYRWFLSSRMRRSGRSRRRNVFLVSGAVIRDLLRACRVMLVDDVGGVGPLSAQLVQRRGLAETREAFERKGTYETQSFVIEPFNRVKVNTGEDDFGEEIEDEVLQVPK